MSCSKGRDWEGSCATLILNYLLENGAIGVSKRCWSCLKEKLGLHERVFGGVRLVKFEAHCLDDDLVVIRARRVE